MLIHNYNSANIDRAVGHSPAVGEFISSKEEEFLKELFKLTSDWSIREDSREKNQVQVKLKQSLLVGKKAKKKIEQN